MGRESGEPSKRKSYLPAEKQFLITRNGKGLDLWLWLPILHYICQTVCVFTFLRWLQIFDVIFLKVFVCTWILSLDSGF